jgi:hypothetical protein
VSKEDIQETKAAGYYCARGQIAKPTARVFAVSALPDKSEIMIWPTLLIATLSIKTMGLRVFLWVNFSGQWSER